MSDLESYVSNKVINGHCDCMFLVNSYAWEWTTIAALVAPRPLLFCNSDNDTIFPMDGNRRIMERLRKLYGMYGKPELVDEYVSHGGHEDRPDMRVAAFKWINKHLKNDTGPVKEAALKPLPGEQLRVFPTDKDIPADALNGKIDETFVQQAQVKLPEPGDFARWKNDLGKKLRNYSFRRFPYRIPEWSVFKDLKLVPAEGTTFYLSLTSEPGIAIDGVYDKRGDTDGPGTLIVLNPEDRLSAEIPQWAKPFAGDKPVLVILQTRGGGRQAWTRKSPPNYVERAHALLGQTIDQGRVWDIAAEARHRQWKVLGRGHAGILAAYAALFEPNIAEVVVVDPPTSHRDGPIFLNVLRVLDIPDALGLLAPRPLTLVNAGDKAFDKTAQIYKLAGAEDKLQRK
jgi:hypothetical protein